MSDPFATRRRVRVVRLSETNNTDPNKLEFKKNVFNQINKTQSFIIMNEETRKGDTVRSFDLKTLYSIWFEDEIESTDLPADRLVNPDQYIMSYPPY